MAKSTRIKKGKDIPVTNRSIFWSDLNSLPEELKNETWAAELLYFMKRNAKLFLDPKRAAAYRATDRLELDERIYKEMVDPTTPMGQGGTASYFSSDWKANPSYLHLKNIVKARLEKTGKQFEINLTDKYAKTRQMNDNYTILYRDLFRSLINEYAPQVGLPTISDKEDPFKWVKKFTEDAKDQPQNDVVTSYVDLIKNQITDSQDLAMYNELIYKGDYEAAFELGIDYYLMKLNKWQDRHEDKFVDDFMHFNKGCGEWYTDLMTGRPVVERFVPEKLWVSPFSRKDGDDLMYYFIEYEITFGDFAKTIGAKLDGEKLKQVFLYQKTQGSNHGINWVETGSAALRTRDNAMIRVGRAAALTQDIVVGGGMLMDDLNPQSPFSTNTATTWDKMQTEAPVEKYFNVWYSFYYIPPTTSSLSNADYGWQAQFIFDIKKNQDQMRYGEDGRYSKCPLVIYDNSSQASFTDITQYYMPKIHHAAHKFQNCLVNDLDAVVLADDFIGGLLNAVDEDNKINPADPNQPTGGNGRDAMMEQWKMIKQGGTGFLKMTDKNGQLILDPNKLVLSIKNNYLEKAEKYLQLIAMLYDEMSRSLAQSSATSGENIKPRTPVAAIEQSVQSSQDSTFAIQKSYEAFVKMYGERMIQYIIMIAKEAHEDGYTKRWNDFLDNVGYANGLAVEGMADVPPEAVGLSVEWVDTTAKKEFLMQLATEYVKTKQLGEEFLNLLLSVDNWKEGFMLFRLGVKKAKKEAQEAAAIQQQYIMEQKNADLQIAQAMQQGKTQGEVQKIQAQGQVQSQLNSQMNNEKFQSQKALKDITTQNRITEQLAKLDKENSINLQQPLNTGS